MLYGGSFGRCRVRFPASGGAEEATFDCNDVVEGDVTWTNRENVRDLHLDWIAEWELPPDTPVAPNYVVSSNIGVISTSVDLELINHGEFRLQIHFEQC